MTDDARPHPHLLVHRDGNVLTLTLDNPTRRNAQTPSLWLALAEQARAVDDDIRVVVLAGTGSSFSAGLDRGMLAPGGLPGEPDLLGEAARDAGALDAAIASYQEAFTSWRSCPAVVIAAVQGHAVGAGFQLALGADLRVVAQDVQFQMAEPSLGLVPDLGGTAVLVELVGYARALEICLTGRRVGAAEAVAMGLATIAVEPAGLADTTADLVSAVLAAPPAAVRATKALLAGARGRTIEEQARAERTAQLSLLAGIAARLRG